MTLQQAAKQALDIQDACNLSGVVYSFAQAMDAICAESYRLGRGTAWKNTHPIVTLHLLKLAELNHCGSTLHSSYELAERECRNIAGVD